MYSADGRQIGTFTWSAPWNNTQTQVTIAFTVATRRSYFGGKLVAQWNGAYMQSAVQDRLGSVGKYYPYGEERNSPPLINDQVKFATYTRDSGTGLDYADQRYYASTFGRFMTPDPYRASGGPANPQSWNRYSYVLGDPVNFRDHSGLVTEDKDAGDWPDCYTYEDGTFCYFYSNDGGSHGGTSGRKPTKFEKAFDRLSGAQEKLSSRSGYDVNCGKDAAALGLNINQIFDRAADLNIKDGTTSNLPVSTLYGDTTAGNSFQNEQDKEFGPGQTISNYFGRNPKGIVARTVLSGDTMFINPDLIGGSLTYNEALLLHEALHALGLIDTDIQDKLHLKVDPNDTTNITDKLKRDCIKGKNNY